MVEIPHRSRCASKHHIEAGIGCAQGTGATAFGREMAQMLGITTQDKQLVFDPAPAVDKNAEESAFGFREDATPRKKVDKGSYRTPQEPHAPAAGGHGLQRRALHGLIEAVEIGYRHDDVLAATGKRVDRSTDDGFVDTLSAATVESLCNAPTKRAIADLAPSLSPTVGRKRSLRPGHKPSIASSHDFPGNPAADRTHNVFRSVVVLIVIPVTRRHVEAAIEVEPNQALVHDGCLGNKSSMKAVMAQSASRSAAPSVPMVRTRALS
jgi:hypothetical protein